ncbi:ABC transporter permease [Microbacteriaceae bacterium VKM Ac-2855]|nr:ABC transporter permease [Microbacteriaceae bacterium VKM Ac-2855]
MSAFAGAVRSEIGKVLTTRLWWILALVLVGYVGLMAGGFAALFNLPGMQMTDASGQPVDGATAVSPLLVYGLASSIGYVFPVLFGGLAVTGEFRHQTLTPTFLATPRRGVALGAKALVLTGFGLVYGLIGLVASVGVGAVVLTLFGVDPLLGDSETWAMIGRTAAAMALWAMIGGGLGVLVPNQAAVIVIVLAFTQFIEPLLRAASAFVDWTRTVALYLPGSASDTLSGASVFSALMSAGAGAEQEWWQGGLILIGYAVALLGLGYLTTWRRDVT